MTPQTYRMNTNIATDLIATQNDNGICADMIATGGVIRSPNYPNYLGLGVNRMMVYFIEVSKDKQISLSFDDFGLQTNKSFVYVS